MARDTVAGLESIYRAAAIDRCIHTPFLFRYNEQSINGQMVTERTLCKAFSAVEEIRGDISLTPFEFGTPFVVYLNGKRWMYGFWKWD